MKFNFLNKLFGSTNERKITALNPIVQKINSLEESIKKLSDSELKVRTEELRKIAKESKDLDKLLPEAFALVRSWSKNHRSKALRCSAHGWHYSTSGKNI